MLANVGASDCQGGAQALGEADYASTMVATRYIGHPMVWPVCRSFVLARFCEPQGHRRRKQPPPAWSISGRPCREPVRLAFYLHRQDRKTFFRGRSWPGKAMASTRRRSAAVARLCGLPAALLAVSVAAHPLPPLCLCRLMPGHRPVPSARTPAKWQQGVRPDEGRSTNLIDIFVLAGLLVRTS